VTRARLQHAADHAGSQFRCAVCRAVFAKGMPPDTDDPLLDSFPGFMPYECHLVCDDCFAPLRPSA
jgi:hypothetical protein